ncbi:hypothetical protein GGI1_04849 [Acidithiobacillus sp. GGI-221]|nr:hypothetical protein GGI1_04849 [Acidithiobacillus sp. GGI-221]
MMVMLEYKMRETQFLVTLFCMLMVAVTLIIRGLF